MGNKQISTGSIYEYILNNNYPIELYIILRLLSIGVINLFEKLITAMIFGVSSPSLL